MHRDRTGCGAASLSRRRFLSGVSLAAAAVAVGTRPSAAAAQVPAGVQMAFGLVTYQWGKDWDLPTLLRNCERAGVAGVELRTTHAHGVEPSLSAEEREAVRRQFAASQVTLVGLGSNERFDDPDPAVVQRAIDASKEFIRLSHDVGGTGVKVKPDRFHDSVPRQQTIEQIGRALNELGEFGAGFGQQVRLEVHGQCAELPTIKAIMDIATHENVAVCWNCNPQDLQGEGLEANFALVRDRFGATCHVRPFDSPQYPTAAFLNLLVQSKYEGWVLLEDGNVPPDPAEALKHQSQLFEQLLRSAAK